MTCKLTTTSTCTCTTPISALKGTRPEGVPTRTPFTFESLVRVWGVLPGSDDWHSVDPPTGSRTPLLHVTLVHNVGDRHIFSSLSRTPTTHQDLLWLRSWPDRCITHGPSWKDTLIYVHPHCRRRDTLLLYLVWTKDRNSGSPLLSVWTLYMKIIKWVVCK